MRSLKPVVLTAPLGLTVTVTNGRLRRSRMPVDVFGTSGTLGATTGVVVPPVGPVEGTAVPPVYQLVRPLPPARLSEMCTWLRCRSVSEHELSTLQPL